MYSVPGHCLVLVVWLFSFLYHKLLKYKNTYRVTVTATTTVTTLLLTRSHMHPKKSPLGMTVTEYLLWSRSRSRSRTMITVSKNQSTANAQVRWGINESKPQRSRARSRGTEWFITGAWGKEICPLPRSEPRALSKRWGKKINRKLLTTRIFFPLLPGVLVANGTNFCLGQTKALAIGGRTPAGSFLR